MKSDLKDSIVVCGGGGFIGGHLVADLARQGYQRIRAVDIKPLDEWYQRFPDVENLQLDLQEKEACAEATRGSAVVFNLAADMGGMGFIENNRALCMLSVLINTHLLMAARELGVRRFFFSSSACVYAADKQTSEKVVPLKEGDAYPAMPRMDTDGKSFSVSACAGTSGRTSASRHELHATIMFTDHMAPGREAAKRRRRPSAAK